MVRASFTLYMLVGCLCAAVGSNSSAADHPRLYFRADALPRLRQLKQHGPHRRVWANLTASADWCADQPPRTEWIPTLADDPQYENLYDRFYAAMHDMAIIEHLAFASVLSNPEDNPYFEPARDWACSAARVWRNEADNPPDASKAYAVLRVMKAMAVSYDLLYTRLSKDERDEIRQALVAVSREYFTFFQDKTTAGAGYNKHHGSVDAAPFGVVALALLGEVPEAQVWLNLMIEKHTAYLLPHALTPSGTNDQSSNFWASTLHYRIFFLDALRRVTGRDLMAEFPDALPGRMALAATAGTQPRNLRYNEAYEPGDFVIGFKQGGLVVHAGGRPVFVDQMATDDVNNPAQPIKEMLLADDGRTALIRCVGPAASGLGVQQIRLERHIATPTSRGAA